MKVPQRADFYYDYFTKVSQAVNLSIKQLFNMNLASFSYILFGSDFAVKSLNSSGKSPITNDSAIYKLLESKKCF